MHAELEVPETEEMPSDLQLDNQETLFRVIKAAHAELVDHVVACGFCRYAMPLLRPSARQRRFYVVEQRCAAGLVIWRRFRLAVDRAQAVANLRRRRYEPRWGFGAIASWTQDVADGLARAIATRKRRKFDVRALARDDHRKPMPLLTKRPPPTLAANN